ncbi:MAG: ImuA family protein [Caulobacterales bacterium]|jgi:protein ImuA
MIAAGGQKPPQSNPRRADPAALADLRLRLAQMGGAGMRPVVRLGVEALQAALPGGGLARGAVHELSAAAPADMAAAYGFTAALAARAGAGGVIWLVWRGASDCGAPYGPGLAALGLDPARIVFVVVDKPDQALWALEEALATPGLGAVIGDVPPRLDLAAQRRLHLAAERSGGFGLLLRPRGGMALAPARSRWRIAAAPSAPPLWAAGLPLAPPGAPTWQAELCHIRGGAPQTLVLEWTDATGGFRLAGSTGLSSAEPRRALG